MLDLLNGFVVQLREAGLPVSLTENLDAMDAVQHIPIEDAKRSNMPSVQHSSKTRRTGVRLKRCSRCISAFVAPSTSWQTQMVTHLNSMTVA